MLRRHASLVLALILLVLALCIFNLNGFSSSLFSYNRLGLLQDVAQVGHSNETVQVREEHDLHSSHIGLMEWQSWERANNTNTTIPSGIPKTCAIGTISNGGSLVALDSCGEGSRAYQRVQNQAHALLHTTAHHNNNNNTANILCDVCRIVTLAWQQNLSLAFWGDSVHHQNVQGFLCELIRRNYTVVETEHRDIRLSYCTGMNCLKRQMTYQVASPLWNSTTTTTTTTTNVTLYYFQQYKPRMDREEFYNTSLSRILAVQPDIMVFNFGLHYKFHQRSKHQTAMTIILDALQHYGQNTIQLLAYRETTAQHFAAPWGEYGFQTNTSNCVPLASYNGTVPFGWRDLDTRHYAEQLGYTIVDPTQPKLFQDSTNKNNDSSMELVWLPFRNYSGHFHDLHPSHECTHYCHTPYLWYPLWRSLRRAMDRRFAFERSSY